MSGSDLDYTQFPPPTGLAAGQRRAAQLVCARAALRGVFPTDELAECLRMLGLYGPDEEGPMP